MGEVDPAFFQAVEHRPNLKVIGAEGIPIIDLSTPNTSEIVGNACKEWGFFQVINHGVSLEKREKIFDASAKFFGQSLEEKRKVKRDDKNVVGYYDTEHTKNVRDWKEVFDFALHSPVTISSSHLLHDSGVTNWHNQWPQYPPELREVCEEYGQEMENLAFKLLELIAHSLGLNPDRFNGFFKEETSFIRLNRYPPCPVPHLALGVGRHKDSGALTILAQDDVGGLEVKRKSDGEWIWVTPIPNAYIINVGDIIEVWSNGAYESVEHRVRVNCEKERFSIPYFFNPAHYTLVRPLEEISKDPKFKAYNWGKFMVNRTRSNFQKLQDENIQIHQFKI